MAAEIQAIFHRFQQAPMIRDLTLRLEVTQYRCLDRVRQQRGKPDIPQETLDYLEEECYQPEKAYKRYIVDYGSQWATTHTQLCLKLHPDGGDEAKLNCFRLALAKRVLVEENILGKLRSLVPDY